MGYIEGQKQERHIMLTEDEYESLLRWQVLDQGPEAVSYSDRLKKLVDDDIEANWGHAKERLESSGGDNPIDLIVQRAQRKLGMLQ